MQQPIPITPITTIDYSKITEFYSNFLQYRPALRKYFGKVTTVILLNQIERWFAHKPNIFYKFLAPCQHDLYRQGDSWEEELGFSVSEFRSAFDEIGIRYRSRNEVLTLIEAGEDPFDGKYYLSYKDVRKGLTYYLRNSQAVNALFKKMIRESKATSLKFDFEDEEKCMSQEQILSEQLEHLKKLIVCRRNNSSKEMKKSISGNKHFGDQDCGDQKSYVPERKNYEIPRKKSSLPYNEQENTTIITQEKAAAKTSLANNTNDGCKTKFAAASFCDNDFIVEGKLTASQVERVKQFITNNFQTVKHFGDEAILQQAMVSDLANPKCFTQAGNDFHKKFNTLKKAMLANKWTPREYKQQEKAKQASTAVKLRQAIQELEHSRHSFMSALQSPLATQPGYKESCESKIKTYDESLAPLYQQLKELKGGVNDSNHCRGEGV